MIDARVLPVSMVVAGAQISGWSQYDIMVSMTEPVATFALRLPFDADAWDLTAPDRPMQIRLGDVPILTGFIDESDMPEDSPVIDISGRCRVGRLADETAPGINFSGLGVFQLVEKLIDPWFKKLATSNARNRDVVRGKGKKARAGSEPVKFNTRTGTTIEPGQTRLAAIERLMEQTGYSIWSSGDAKELVLGKPNYEQEVQFQFYRPAPNSKDSQLGNVQGMEIKRSTAERYSRIICVGSGKGTAVNYGKPVSSRFGQAKNNPATAQGEGKDFSAPKTLVIQHSIKSIDEGTELAKREMAQRDAAGRPLSVRVAGHGQLCAGSHITVFAPDTMAYVLDEWTGTRGIYLITSCRYRTGRDGGEETVMELVPKGTELAR